MATKDAALQKKKKRKVKVQTWVLVHPGWLAGGWAGCPADTIRILSHFLDTFFSPQNVV
jgi:hypothetical protein